MKMSYEQRWGHPNTGRKNRHQQELFRQKSAAIRQDAHSGLTTDQKLAKLSNRVGPTGAVKERNRLIACMEKANV